MQGYDSFYRIRSGEYQIGIEIVNEEIIFTRFLHRKDVYKYFP
jgi:mRNA interferase RelE/StbE